MDFPMLKAMLAAQKMLRRRRDVRCAIVHGDGPSFCAGLDIKSVMSNKAQAFALYLKLWWPFANAFQCFSIEIGRASCRERVGKYVSFSVVAVALKKK